MMVQPSRQEKKTSKERIRVHIDDYLASQGSCLTGRGSKRKIYSFIHSIYTSSSATWRYSFYYREVITFRHIFTNKQWSINRTIRKNSSNTGTFLLLGFALGSTTLDFGFSFGGFSFDGISSGSSRCRFSSWCLLGGAGSLGLNNSIKGFTEHGIHRIGSQHDAPESMKPWKSLLGAWWVLQYECDR